ncbi:MAG: aldehyde ferredoxin oxidoreductase [Anaerolineae bacterium]|jgi:aldehyde:ferredoxin oxidoreductase|nr:aldehyde ferredoxin oxidoreductase [Anaerolineae bacterium]MBT4458085.1 aldehyde ferredoxin oxidoreductase [Anaerolineae bacterium]MBT6323353.1 aldehyde ferredoxin oxidoreductase [Anaerolineae bacterium]MBT6811077.1 aldehyde ferredoxin oxidoreductase [Anaerolineae bacterium]MBT7016312.1 aldehyde ferredoxin oxidoreductase [Anaerolineae bacterium]
MKEKILRINTAKRKSQKDSVPETWQHLGGRGLLACILVDEVPATCEPLGAKNKLIFAPGLMVGHRLSSCDRISIGGKSPLTGGVKEANAGGTTGLAIAQLGIKAIILEDKPINDAWQIIHISAEGVKFESADELIGMGVYETAPHLLEKYGKKVAIALIGQGGEMELSAAGIQNLDKEGIPSRMAGRGGLGALMGSKRIKAIVIDFSGGKKPSIADQPAFNAAKKSYTKALIGHPQTKTYHDYGTASMVNMTSYFGSIPTRGFSEGTFEGAEKISGENMRETLLERGGESNPSHACMPACTIQCSNIYGGEDGKTLVSPLEYETIGLLGSNLGIDDLDTVARLNWELNDLGLDTIEIGAALGVAAQAGLLDWNDGTRALQLVSDIKTGSPLGRILGNGAATTGKVLGVERVPVVKGQAMPAYDPRAIKGTGVTFATSPQGADHTCGLTIRAKIKHTEPEGQAELSRGSQINMAGFDTLGACLFAGFGFAAATGSIAALLNARYGWDVDENILQELGKETLKLERKFNRLAGFTPADDRLPEWMTRETLPPTNAVFDVSDEDLDNVFKW